jgi:hypothetical protein
MQRFAARTITMSAPTMLSFKMLIKRAYTHYTMGRRLHFSGNIKEWATLYE